MDNRIFNNLKQQLNEMIDDEKSLISIDEFKKLFFTYFKGEVKASVIYEDLLPCITMYEQDKKAYDTVPPTGDYQVKVSIQKLTKFIDAFNFHPVRVNRIHSKNSSTELTYIMT